MKSISAKTIILSGHHQSYYFDNYNYAELSVVSLVESLYLELTNEC